MAEQPGSENTNSKTLTLQGSEGMECPLLPHPWGSHRGVREEEAVMRGLTMNKQSRVAGGIARLYLKATVSEWLSIKIAEEMLGSQGQSPRERQ